MKELLSIHDFLVSADTMSYWEDDALEAAERFNFIMHTSYDLAAEDIETQFLERLLINISETWIHDPELLNIDDDELVDWVKQRFLQAEDEELQADENPQEYE